MQGPGPRLQAQQAGAGLLRARLGCARRRRQWGVHGDRIVELPRWRWASGDAGIVDEGRRDRGCARGSCRGPQCKQAAVGWRAEGGRRGRWGGRSRRGWRLRQEGRGWRAAECWSFRGAPARPHQHAPPGRAGGSQPGRWAPSRPLEQAPGGGGVAGGLQAQGPASGAPVGPPHLRGAAALAMPLSGVAWRLGGARGWLHRQVGKGAVGAAPAPRTRRRRGAQQHVRLHQPPELGASGRAPT